MVTCQGYHLGQCDHRTFLSSQKVLLDRALPEHAVAAVPALLRSKQKGLEENNQSHGKYYKLGEQNFFFPDLFPFLHLFSRTVIGKRFKVNFLPSKDFSSRARAFSFTVLVFRKLLLLALSLRLDFIEFRNPVFPSLAAI